MTGVDAAARDFAALFDRLQWAGWFVTAEDLILLKLLADRPKDRIDIADTLFIQGRVDESYLRHWATTLGVVPQLDAALAADRP